MNTDTPRTDDEESRIQCDLSSMKLAGWNAAYHETKEAFIQRVRGILGHNPSAEATNIGMFIKDGRGE
jgi:hypothetical protein